MASKKSDDDVDLARTIVLRREEAFRRYFPVSLIPRETIGGDRYASNQTWDHVLDPPPQQQNNSQNKGGGCGKFKKLEFRIAGLYRNSSQLDSQELKHEFYSKYPVSFDSTTTDETAVMSAWRVDQFTGRTSFGSTRDVPKKFNSYVPEIDLNKIVSELECARQCQNDASASNEQQDDDGNDDVESSTPKQQPPSKKTVVPSLSSLAQAAVTKTMLQDSLLLEERYCTRLQDLRSGARESIKHIVKQGQSVLENSAEAQKVRELRRQLALSEKALHGLQEKTCSEYQIDVDKIQHKYDQDRADAAAEYRKERNALIRQQSEAISAPGMAVCSGCAVPFSPVGRNVNPHDRCSVAGCQSGQFYCLDCSSSRCSQCCAPVCLAHTTFHQFTCGQETPSKCGYSENQKSLERGLANGCCGQDVGYGSHCKVCGVLVCRNCEYRDEPEYPPNYDPERYMEPDSWHLRPKPKKPYCPGCSPVRTIRRAAEPERKRLRKSSKYDDYMAPVERAAYSLPEWEREQQQIHEKWAEDRLGALTKGEFDHALDNLLEEMSERRAEEVCDEVSGISSFLSWLDAGWGGSRYKERVLGMLVDWDTDKGDTAKLCPCMQCKLDSRKWTAELN